MRDARQHSNACVHFQASFVCVFTGVRPYIDPQDILVLFVRSPGPDTTAAQEIGRPFKLQRFGPGFIEFVCIDLNVRIFWKHTGLNRTSSLIPKRFTVRGCHLEFIASGRLRAPHKSAPRGHSD